MSNIIKDLMSSITNNVDVKCALSHHEHHYVDVIIKIEMIDDEFYLTIGGHANGRILRDLELSAQSDNLEDALHALICEIEDNL